MDLNKLRALAGLPASAKKSKKLNEHTVGNLSNGYDMQHKTTKYYSDYFPTGNDYTADDEAGPASAKQGDNAMQKAIKIDKDELNEGKEIHKSLVHAYRNFKQVSESTVTESSERKALMAKYNAGKLSYEELQRELNKLDITDDQPDRSGEAYTDYTMRQGEMGSPDRNR